MSRQGLKDMQWFPKVTWLTGDSVGSWVHFRLRWPRGPYPRSSLPAVQTCPGGWASSVESQALKSRWNWWPGHQKLGSWLRVWLVGVAPILFYVVGFRLSSLSDGALGAEGLWQGVGGSHDDQIEASESVLPLSWDRAGMVPLSEAPAPWSHSGCQGWSLASTALVFTYFWVLSFWVIFGGFSGIYSYCMVSYFQCFHFFFHFLNFKCRWKVQMKRILVFSVLTLCQAQYWTSPFISFNPRNSSLQGALL